MRNLLCLGVVRSIGLAPGVDRKSVPNLSGHKFDLGQFTRCSAAFSAPAARSADIL
ncbi:MAG: hypothetical protein HXX10_11615 [Rhodoplanes sp.]|uniref:hypothetical protein n=1 Tax=Rhodoplanes sp. TaxID=1968906 RepID=UPI0018380A1F|nr:hypothetical protein [Rhodoplanes sp.]NVO14675.1 hypothetical protein [Rhodoplanes sp.]